MRINHVIVDGLWFVKITYINKERCKMNRFIEILYRRSRYRTLRPAQKSYYGVNPGFIYLDTDVIDDDLLLIGKIYSFALDGVVFIRLKNQEEYLKVKKYYLAYKRAYRKNGIFNKKISAPTFEEMYKKANTDMDMYCNLVARGYLEEDIRNIIGLYLHNGDIYNNALDELALNFFSEV